MMSYRIWLWCSLGVFLGTGAVFAEGPVDYLRDVKPLLMQRCQTCHGALKQGGGLRLDAAELIRKGGASGPAIEPGQSADSLLIDAITGANGAQRMPLEGEPLTAAQIETLKSWIDQGGIAPDEKIPEDPRLHWAFRVPVAVTPPQPAKSAWVRNPIDAFIAAEHEKIGLSPQPEVEKHVLLRRVYLDLIGLPPTREELHQFLADEDPGAYEKVVDRLLSSPQYGVRWGRHWMDVWRYSDWAGWGQQIRDSQPHIWRWRDWIVESLNEGKGYDEMVVEMLAGDEIAPGDERVLRATGYLARNFKLLSRETWIQDTVNHTAKAFLALTMDCARCHDHMYDPISQQEYYRMRAVFEPHNVRIDRLPGQSDTGKDGLPRVFDADLSAATYLFMRGDDRQPQTDKPLAPGVPQILGGEFHPAVVNLPASAAYPGLRTFVQTETIAQADEAIRRAEEAVTAAAAALETAKRNVPPTPAALSGAETPAEQTGTDAKREEHAAALKKAELATTLATRQLVAARMNRIALDARIAADKAAFAVPAAPNAAALATAAAKLDRQAAHCKSEEAIALSEQKLFVAQQALKADDEKTKAAVTAAEKKLEEARKGLEATQAALGKEGNDYPSLGARYPATSTRRRLALARWLVSGSNPLTARVAVNHVWLRHFGEGLVSSVFDFGLNGKRPSHPELLDWLAVELMSNGWKMKPLHRLIVTSSTYRLASTSSPANRALDPDNKYLWQASPRRMEAEIVRDSVLYASGQLDTRLEGPDLDPKEWLSIKRRSVFFRHAQEKQMVFMKLFDGATVNECYTRKESIVPQQALALANSELSLHQGRVLARSLEGMGSPGDPGPFVTAAFEQILSRTPNLEELYECCSFLTQQERFFRERNEAPAGATDLTDATKPANDPRLRARENLVHVLINHNDFVTIR